MYVIVVGAGEVGSSIAESLSVTHEVVVIDIDPDRVDRLTYALDVLAIQGDGSSLETLREAGIEEADMLIASTDNDEINMVTCGTSSTVSDAFTVARVKNTRYFETWQASPGAFGVDFMVCTNLLAAESVVRVVGLPAARDVDTFADGSVSMAEFEVPEESPVANQSVSQADRFEELTFAAIIHEEQLSVPKGDTIIEEGDEIVVIGTPESVRAFGADIAPHRNESHDIVILGGSEIGYETASLLEDRGFKPKLVEENPERARELAELLPDTTVLESDATDRAFLERKNFDEADVSVATLESDEKNLLVALLAKRIGVERSVAIVDDSEYVDLFEEVGVDVAINPREAVAEEITRFTREQNTQNVALIEGDQAEIIEIEVDSESVLVGRPIHESVRDLPDGIVIGAVTRNGTFITPRGETVVQEKDHVVIFVNGDVISEAMEVL